jgi:hypothetical protein
MCNLSCKPSYLVNYLCKWKIIVGKYVWNLPAWGPGDYFFQFCDIENLASFSKKKEGNFLKFMVEKTQLIQKLPNSFVKKMTEWLPLRTLFFDFIDTSSQPTCSHFCNSLCAGMMHTLKFS